MSDNRASESIQNHENILMQNVPISKPLFKTCVPITKPTEPFLPNKGDQATQILNINHTNHTKGTTLKKSTAPSFPFTDVKFNLLENSYHPISC